MNKFTPEKYSHQNAQTHPKQYISMYMQRYVSDDLKNKNIKHKNK